jgi:hypothetical protein
MLSAIKLRPAGVLNLLVYWSGTGGSNPRSN